MVLELCISQLQTNMQKTIFITGASSGLGKATAIYFQAKGWKVIATMRTPEKETELNTLENITLMKLDVTNFSQIEEVVAKATTEHDVDVVFNNAGYGIVGALESFTDEQITRQLNTNLLGVIRITKAFIPFFKAKQSGLFLTTTSIGGTLAYPLHSMYQATKFGVEGWSESMSFELGIHNIGIKTIAPGAIATDFIGRSLDKNSHADYKVIEDQLYGSFEPMMEQAASAEAMAALVFEAATDGKDQIKYILGADAQQMYEAHTKMGSEEFRKMIRKQFVG